MKGDRGGGGCTNTRTIKAQAPSNSLENEPIGETVKGRWGSPSLVDFQLPSDLACNADLLPYLDAACSSDWGIVKSMARPR